MPDDLRGVKVRPANATMGAFMSLLGATNVQASAPEVRETLERGVADEVTFPWGSIMLFGIDKVVKFHMDMPFWTGTFVWAMNKAKYEAMSPAQRTVIDNHCTTEWAVRAASPWADFEHAGIAKIKAEPGHEVYTISAEQLDQWKQAAGPVVKAWGDGVRKNGGDPDAILKDFKATLAKYKAAY